MSCSTCTPGIPEDVQFTEANKKAIEQSKKNNEPVAIYKDQGEYKWCNAFAAYAAGYPVCKVVSPYNGNAA
jgi:hypothetical protein